MHLQFSPKLISKTPIANKFHHNDPERYLNGLNALMPDMSNSIETAIAIDILGTIAIAIAIAKSNSQLLLLLLVLLRGFPNYCYCY